MGFCPGFVLGTDGQWISAFLWFDFVFSLQVCGNWDADIGFFCCYACFYEIVFEYVKDMIAWYVRNGKSRWFYLGYIAGGLSERAGDPVMCYLLCV